MMHTDVLKTLHDTALCLPAWGGLIENSLGPFLETPASWKLRCNTVAQYLNDLTLK